MSEEFRGCWMQTFTGKRFYPLDPRPEDICIEDIAHALSQICRFGGHTKRPYSVAQHSILVSDYLELICYNKETQLKGLLHDSTEAYLGDMVRPVKDLVPEFVVLEKALAQIIAAKFNLTGIWSDVIKHADNILLITEKRDLLPKIPFQWEAERLYTLLDWKIVPMSAKSAEQRFLKRFEELT